jgi:hypothetical protein
MFQVARVSAVTATVGAPSSNEEICSDLVLHMDKPYYVGVSVAGAPGERPTVTFHLKDLSNDEEPLQTVQARADTGVILGGASGSDSELTLGGRRGGQSVWDGLIDDVRLTGAVVSGDRLQWVHEGPLAEGIGLWCFEAKPNRFHDGSGRGQNLRPSRRLSEASLDARSLALADLCHALLNSNGFLFVE